MDLSFFITNSLLNRINESYKMTTNDKDELEKEIRAGYENYKKEIEKDNNHIKQAKAMMSYANNLTDNDDADKAVKQSIIDLHSRPSELELKKPMLFNEFYSKKYNDYKNRYTRYKQKNAPTTFSYKSDKESELENFDYINYTNGLNKDERIAIKNFLEIVGERINSGDGESVSRKVVRDAFFKTPKKFQELFSEKPSPYLWRGDEYHPSDEEYDRNDEDYMAMQSFSIYKHNASYFGFPFKATNIQSYGGSFSIPLYMKYGGDSYDISDEEGEVMFFNVIYKHNKNKEEQLNNKLNKF